MVDTTRRSVLGAAAGLAGVPLIGAASAAEGQPAPLLGHVENGKVVLPSLRAPSEGSETLPNPDPLPRRLGIAVVGIGHLTLEQIMPGFAEARHVKPVALVSGNRDKARTIAAQYGVPDKNLYDYAGFDAIRDNPEIEAVYIVLPNAMHAEFTERAARAGKHVLCEKPMATSVAEAERMVTACRQAGRKLMIAYRLQYNVAHRSLVDLARRKVFGELRLIEAVNTQHDAAPGQWRQIKALAGGGSLPDIGLYCLSAFRYITGEEPVEVTGRITQPRNDPRFREIEDVSQFTLQFPSGVFATGTAGYSMHESRRLRAVATEGWFGLDPAFSYNNLAMEIGHRAGPATAQERRVFAPRNQFAVEMDHFAQCIRADREPHTAGEEGLQDQRIMAAIYEAALGGGVVKMPASDRLDATRGPLPEEQGG
ncbi:Gfo/Idh/MocA family protein [Methylobacterium gnaphalii]|uniref:Glucose-fructose oxidoreductase n=1 Tax=Methylobacterium gnaphalii TaxID=1010610 RepID=A0A512JK75_9HYPH|nr:Gfo/Idh/MocA family oxidoreductase [Methylobacterium gnaphalii]GEP10361.1 glucose-fructose oxidoreductase [Methylobacterium gnaphalii]GJD68520.1 Glucose--fructose oxidoreductase [Methylobacterium gnaphalii]GLS51289.1 glucose-fructose oxidoreductase [Methylobacterium gnaphalii]